ncbi:MAG: PHP domain-containing protein [Parcubacteria group bacterium]
MTGLMRATTFANGMAVDLHIHSSISDGEYTPEKLVAMAKKAGLKAIAVCDHDTTEGSRQAVAAGKKYGVTVIPAVEVSASLRGEVIHIVGYGIDHDHRELNEVLNTILDYRYKRAQSILANINRELVETGKKPVNVQDILDLGKEKPITRADIAMYLLEKRYVKTRNEAFDRWLDKYNISNKDFTVEEAIGAIHRAGGIAVLAHPSSPSMSLNTISTKLQDHQTILSDLHHQGLDGVEVYRFLQPVEEETEYLGMVRAIGLLVTGGTDFHGPHYLGSAETIGAKEVPDSVLGPLRGAIAARRAKNPS